MKKTSIFIITFLVSFLTIYSVYYYTQIRKLDQSVVAMAIDLPNTVYGKADSGQSDKNMIWTRGVNQIINSKDSVQELGNIPDEHFVAFNNAKNKDNLEKFYENLVSKYQNHPPLPFDDVKDGEKIMLSYFFYNVRLPQGFRVSATTVDFHGTKVKSLQYHILRKKDTGTVTFYRNDSTKEYAFRILLNGGTEEAVIYNSTANNSWDSAFHAARLITSSNQYKYSPGQDESILFPELDFNIIKDYSRVISLLKNVSN
jgi:archaellum component FlaF (FlaF/FlaG flagellin family)